MRIRHKNLTVTALALAIAVACVSPRPQSGERHRWWAGLGPVLPHDTFPADCKLCHVGETWNELTEDFSFDHELKTGVPLRGAHAQASCLRCHNDRGPVAVFQARGCAGCHEDVHYGELGQDCAQCHTERNWSTQNLITAHNRTRFPLMGAHALVACHRCHVGAAVGNFVPTDTECLSCHQDELANTTNPPHIPLGFVDNCQRCHIPTRWEQTSNR